MNPPTSSTSDPNMVWKSYFTAQPNKREKLEKKVVDYFNKGKPNPFEYVISYPKHGELIFNIICTLDQDIRLVKVEAEEECSQSPQEEVEEKNPSCEEGSSQGAQLDEKKSSDKPRQSIVRPQFSNAKYEIQINGLDNQTKFPIHLGKGSALNDLKAAVNIAIDDSLL